MTQKLNRCEEDLEERLLKIGLIEDQVEVAEIGVARRRSRMIALQDRSDNKIEKLRNINMKIDTLRGRRTSQCFDANYDLTKIEERSQVSFTDILKLSKGSERN